MTRQQMQDLMEFLAAKKLPRAGVLVAAQLAMRTNGTNDCWVGVERLAAVTYSSEPQVRRSLRLLERLGVLETTHRPGKTNLYTIAPRPTSEGDHLGDTPIIQMIPEVKSPTLVGLPTPSSTPRLAVAGTHAHDAPTSGHTSAMEPTAQPAVAAYVDTRLALGKPLVDGDRGKVGRFAKKALAGGCSLADTVAACEKVAREDRPVSQIPTIAQKVYAPSADQRHRDEFADAWERAGRMGR